MLILYTRNTNEQLRYRYKHYKHSRLSDSPYTYNDAYLPSTVLITCKNTLRLINNRTITHI